MMDIGQARNRAIDFLKDATGAESIRTLKVVRVPTGWEVDAEVFEEDSFIKTLGLPTRVCERNFYTVQLDENLEVVQYYRQMKAA